MKILSCMSGTGRKLSLVGGIGEEAGNRLPVVLEVREHIFSRRVKKSQ